MKKFFLALGLLFVCSGFIAKPSTAQSMSGVITGYIVQTSGGVQVNVPNSATATASYTNFGVTISPPIPVGYNAHVGGFQVTLLDTTNSEYLYCFILPNRSSCTVTAGYSSYLTGYSGSSISIAPGDNLVLILDNCTCLPPFNVVKLEWALEQ